MVGILKLDLEDLLKQIQVYEMDNKREPKYIVMSQDTLDVIEDCLQSEFSFINTSSYICGVKIAINDTIKLGRVDVV